MKVLDENANNRCRICVGAGAFIVKLYVMKTDPAMMKHDARVTETDQLAECPVCGGTGVSPRATEWRKEQENGTRD